jgi:hypothetical protein
MNISGANDWPATMTTHMKVNAKCMRFAPLMFIPTWTDITIVHWFDNFQNCATMNWQRNVNSLLPTQLPHTFSYIVAILIHNHFESLNIILSGSHNKLYSWLCILFNQRSKNSVWCKLGYCDLKHVFYFIFLFIGMESIKTYFIQV